MSNDDGCLAVEGTIITQHIRCNIRCIRAVNNIVSVRYVQYIQSTLCTHGAYSLGVSLISLPTKKKNCKNYVNSIPLRALSERKPLESNLFSVWMHTHTI